MAIDMLSKEYNVKVDRIKFKSLCGDVTINGKNCLLMKPTTYMNNSGQAVVEAMNFYKVPIENIIVIYDDISLEPSKLRIRRKGSDGGHNGIKSIIYLTGEDTFPRVKLGVGKKPHPDYNLADWVLSNFKLEELKLMEVSCSNAVKCVELIVQNKIDEAMNKYNS
jgi:PTH1 family peptidyl-tRNA hydrolase